MKTKGLTLLLLLALGCQSHPEQGTVMNELQSPERCPGGTTQRSWL